MDRNTLIFLLEQLSQPAFLAEDGVLCCANAAFAALGVPNGTPVSRFLYCDRSVLPSRTPETLRCAIGREEYAVRALAFDDGALYLLEPITVRVCAEDLEQTARQLRGSLQQMYSALELLQQSGLARDAKEALPYSSLLQGVFRVERIADRISLLRGLQSGSYLPKPEHTDLGALCGTLLDKAAVLLRDAGITLRAELPAATWIGSVDEKLLTTALWELLSHAASRTADGTLRVSVERLRLKYLRVTVRYRADETLAAETALTELLPSGGQGDPMGLELIRLTAQLHNGSFLTTTDADGETAMVLQLALDQPARSELHSPPIPQARSLDDGLVGLAELLPRTAYRPEDILG